MSFAPFFLIFFGFGEETGSYIMSKEIIITERHEVDKVLEALGIELPDGCELLSFGVTSTVNNERVPLSKKQLVIKYEGVVK